MPAKGPFLAGDPAPHFRQRSISNPRYFIDTAAGRHLVLCFFGSAASDHARAAIAAVSARPDIFNDDRASFFGVSVDPADESDGRVANRYPGYRFLWDFDHSVSALYGAAASDPDLIEQRLTVAPRWVVIDPAMHIVRDIPFRKDRSDIAEVLALAAALPSSKEFTVAAPPAPVIVLQNVFEPELCRRLIAEFERSGGEQSGFMRDIDGKTVGIHDTSHKSRRDHHLADQSLILEAQARVVRRIFPEIAKVHQFKVTRMERYIVACYSAEDGGHFRAHRDNTTRGTAHRRFAVSINLNSEFEGGEISFPEYGARSYKPPAGGAVIFSCSLLHAVSKVTRGRRYAFLPFLYDDAAAKIREQNLVHLANAAAKKETGFSEPV